jgi:ATP-dependent DNA ligase
MRNDIEKIVTQYRDCTVNIIDMLKKDDFNSAQSEVKNRRNILNKIVSMNDKKEEVKMLYEKLKIKQIEDEAAKLMRDKSSKIKLKLNNISVNKAASSAYGNLGSSAKIFSKKI